MSGGTGSEGRDDGAARAELERLVVAEQVRTLYRQGLPILLANTVNAMVVVGVMWSSAQHDRLLLWFGLLVAITVARIGLQQRYKAASRRAAVASGLSPSDSGSSGPPLVDVPRWARRFTLGSAIAGSMWGAAAIAFITPEAHVARLILSFMIGGMAAGAAGTLASYGPAFGAFVTPALVALATRLYVGGGTLQLAMSATVLFFGVALTFAARNNNRALRRAFRLRFEKGALLDSLSAAQSSLADANAGLERRVAERTVELERRVRREEVLADFGQKALSTTAPDDLFAVSLEVTRPCLTAEVATVMELFAQGQSLLLRTSSGLRPSNGVTLIYLASDGLAAMALRGAEAVCVDDFEVPASPVRAPWMREHGIRSAAAAVIAGQGEPFGLLAAYSPRPGAFGPEEAKFLRVLAGLLGNAIERQRATEALQASEQKAAELVRESPDGIASLSPTGVIEACNPALERITGMERQALVGKRLTDLPLLALDMMDLFQEEFVAVVGGMGGEARTPIELELRQPGGQLVTIEVATRLIARRDGTRGVQITVRDASERKRIERERAEIEETLRQSQRMESVGRLAGGVAHDFNNLLTIIQSNAALLASTSADAAPTRELATEISETAARGAALVRQLLAFSRRQVVEPKVLDLNVMVLDLQRLLSRVLGSGVELTVALDPGTANIKADPSQIEQLVVNLAANARDAMPNGGRLTIETSTVDLGRAEMRGRARLAPGTYILLSVRDNGEGMNAQTRSRIFEPFFTTRPVGHGTGLGLATVYGIVQQAGGGIYVESEVGAGTTFKVYLPRSAEAPVVAGPKEIGAGRPSLARPSATILLVEDDPAVRRSTERVLEMAGHIVLPASDGEVALEVARAHEGTIDLLMTDVIMPRLGGVALANKLSPERPQMRILFASGFVGDNMPGGRPSLGPGVDFIQKPFHPESLLQHVTDSLGPPDDHDRPVHVRVHTCSGPAIARPGTD